MIQRRKPFSERRTERIVVLVNKREKETIERSAKRNACGVSVYGRIAMLKATKDKE